MKVIGLTGVARSGKDTFCKTLIDLFKEKDICAKRFAIADALKDDINPFLISKFGIDVFNCSAEQKEFIRPMMVAYGKCKRKETEGKYWTSILENKIKNDNCDIAIITDVRYCEFEKDEAHWIKNVMSGKLIHISRVDKIEIWEPCICKKINGDTVKSFGENDIRELHYRKDYIQPANEDEEINDPRMIKSSDASFIWNTSNDNSYLKKEVKDFINYTKILHIRF